MNESPQWGGHGFNEVPQLDAAGASPQWFLTGCSLGEGVVSADATPRPDDRLALPDCRRGDGLDSRPVRQSKASHRVLLIDWYLWTLICEWHLISDRA